MGLQLRCGFALGLGLKGGFQFMPCVMAVASSVVVGGGCVVGEFHFS